MLTAEQKLDALTNLGAQLNRLSDLDILMERILSEARRFVNADAGSIYIRHDRDLRFTYTQNATLQERLPSGEKLVYSTFAIPVDENSIAGWVATAGRPLNLKDVYELDNSVPYSFSRQFDETTGYHTQSMLTLPLATSRADVVGVLQIINARDDRGRIISFSREDEKMMAHFASTATVALEKARMTRDIILRMIRMAEMRDPKETGAHVNRVASYSVELYEKWAQKQGFSREEIDAKRDILRMAAMLHDVGKVGISDTILKKPGRFTEEEFNVMKEHTLMGGRLFKDKRSEFDDAAAEVAVNHHEKWNGLGYPGYVDMETGRPLPGYETPDGRPKGKAGKEIPLYGRIVAIADVYDALCSQRVYKPAWEEKDALDILEKDAGSHFDPELIELFFSRLDVIRSIRERYPDED